MENNQIANEAIKEATDSIKEDSLNNVEEKLANVEKNENLNNDKNEDNKDNVKTPSVDSSLIKTPSVNCLVKDTEENIIDKISKIDAIYRTNIIT